MKFDIQGLGFTLTAALVDHTERRLRFALTRTSARIKRVVVRFGDTDGPRGGANKYCRMQVYLDYAPHVLIEDVGADLYAVIDRVADRIRRNVAKRIDRQGAGVQPAKLGRKRARSGDDSGKSDND